MNNSILQEIISDKKSWIKIQTKKTPIEKLQNYVQPSRRNFYYSLNKQKTVFILECKKASPSQGIICKNFNIVEIANIYKNYASAISVLTDEKYFHGNFHFLRQVSEIVTQPILCKDFIISVWQIYFSRLHQADAILLMLSILNDEKYKKLKTIADKLNMGILTEVSNEEEWKRAINLKAKIIGINNRNLNNFTIDLQRTIQLVKNKNKPKNTIIISESGITNNQEIRKLSQYVNGFLIGSALTKSNNIQKKIKKIILGENKICGLTQIQDAQAAYNAGAIYGGLIFIPKSPRFININKALHIIHNVKNLHYVGVFRNLYIEDLIKIIKLLNLSSVQLHGEENDSYIKMLYDKISTNCSIWKALNANITLKNVNKFNNIKEIKRYVLDNDQGGTGKTFDWSLLKKITFKKKNTILSGGLTVENCSKAAQLGCAGLDFNSGVEKFPGIKDYDKLNKIFQILQDY